MDKGRIAIIGLILAIIAIAKGVGMPEPRTGQNAPILATPTPSVANEIKQLISKHGLDPKLVSAIITVESAWQTEAIGTSGEVGLMQLMPKTALAFGVKNRKDPIQNVKGGIAYLAYCKRKTGKAYIRCYNAGEFKTHLPQAYAYEKKVLAAKAKLG